MSLGKGAQGFFVSALTPSPNPLEGREGVWGEDREVRP